MSHQVSIPDIDPQHPEGPVLLTWKDLTVTAGPKVLLKKVQGQIKGGFMAIMGPSGSGKTTLLNTLACRLDRNQDTMGALKLNGKDYSSAQLKRMGGYVMQDDLLNGDLTVEETLRYTAKLRLSPSITKEEREERITKVIAQVGLTHARTTIVGDPLRRGLSGGERKRLCVAIELLTQPKLLFLDEPTSGLDSVTALALCTLLKQLADNRSCTVVCTIHQPQSKIFALFDSLTILKSGDILYQGSAMGAVDFFAHLGHPCPPYTNPADHLLDVITHELDTEADEGSTHSLSLSTRLAQHKPSDVDLHKGQERELLLRDVVPWSTQFTILLGRCFREARRRPAILATMLVQNVVMGVLIGCVFLHIGTTQSSVTRRQPVLFFCVINQGIFSALVTINMFPAERVLSLRERAAGTYYASAYYLAKTAADMLLQLPSPILFSCAVYWLVGFQAAAGKFLVFMLFMVLCSNAATSLAVMVSALCRTTDLSVTVLPIALELARLFGGFFLAPANLPGYFSWLDALSYVKYTYTGIALNELRGLQLSCTEAELQRAGGVCPVTDGQQTIAQLGLGYISVEGCALVLLAFIVFCRTVGYLGIRVIKW